jgi:hypothetical protein
MACKGKAVEYGAPTKRNLVNFQPRRIIKKKMNLANAHGVAAILHLEYASFRSHPFRGMSVRQNA